MKVSLICLALLLGGQVFADNSCKSDDQNFRCVKVLRIYDGDTLFVTIPNVHPLLGKNIGVRVRSIDTPEISTKDPCEKRMGFFAKKQVVDLLSKAKRVDLLNVSREKYFRILADVTIDGRPLAQYLLNKGLAYEYFGGTKQHLDWCSIEKHMRTPASDKGASDGGHD